VLSTYFLFSFSISKQYFCDLYSVLLTIWICAFPSIIRLKFLSSSIKHGEIRDSTYSVSRSYNRTIDLCQGRTASPWTFQCWDSSSEVYLSSRRFLKRWGLIKSLTIVDDRFSKLRYHMIFFVKLLILRALLFEEVFDVGHQGKDQDKFFVIEIFLAVRIDCTFINLIDEVLRRQFSNWQERISCFVVE
jgi:hypothetical protein